MNQVVFNGIQSVVDTMNGNASPNGFSSDVEAMRKHVETVSCYLDGADAVIRAGQKFLKKFSREKDKDYEDRKSFAKFTNVFKDVVENLSAKPFSRTVDLTEPSKKKWPELERFVEDVDGAGNHLHVFAGDVFFNACAYTVDWIVVDKTPGPRGASLAAERAAGARVYWYRVPQADVRAVYSKVVNGKEEFTHFRFAEKALVRKGFGEEIVDRVRVFERQELEDGSLGGAVWVLYERRAGTPSTNNVSETWVKIDSGEFGLGFLPVIPITTGRRKGKSWQFVETMKDVAHLQKVLYNNETNLEYAKVMTSSPMLSAKDAEPPMVTVELEIDGQKQYRTEPAELVVGPKTILYGEWSYVEIGAQSLEFLEKDVQRLERQIRELGRQPLTSDSGNLTTITTAFAAQKGNSAVQGWSLTLKDGLELAFKYTALWHNLRDAEPEVQVYTDFSIDLEPDAAPDFLLSLHERNLISREAILGEGKRRNFLASEYNATTDLEAVKKEREENEFLRTPIEGTSDKSSVPARVPRKPAKGSSQ